MLWIILTVVLALVWLGGWLLASPRAARLGFAFITPIAWLFLTLILSIHQVGQLEAGIPYNLSGTIAGDQAKSPGVVFMAPWQHLKKENVGIQRETFNLTQGSDFGSAVSKDQQPIFAKVTINYQVEPEHVIDLYKRVGPGWKKTLLDSRALQDFKEVTSQYAASEITTRRPQLRADTKARLTDELGNYDIKVVDVFVTNIDYSASYSRAIDAKNRQVQLALQAQAKVAQSQAEAKQAVAQARGEATAIELRGKALQRHPSVLQLEAIDKLSPNVQTIICTGKTCPAFLPSSFGTANGTK